MDKPVVRILVLPAPNKVSCGQYERYCDMLNKAKREYALAASEGGDMGGLIFNILSIQRSMDNFIEKTLLRANLTHEHDKRRR